ALQENIEEQMRRLGFPGENRRFTPHLTLARIKPERGGNRMKLKLLQREIESAPKIETEPFPVDAVCLIQSRLTPQGSVYTVLEEFPLTAPDQIV
ncbi:MAG: hypothetical protein IID18_04295, partial [Nitrospinae bacterium]|nr:hypothetical protein [Nitrospinota bacterium]